MFDLLFFCIWDLFGKILVVVCEGIELNILGFDLVFILKKLVFEVVDWFKFVLNIVVEWLVKGKLVILVCWLLVFKVFLKIFLVIVGILFCLNRFIWLVELFVLNKLLGWFNVVVGDEELVDWKIGLLVVKLFIWLNELCLLKFIFGCVCSIDDFVFIDFVVLWLRCFFIFFCW